MEPPTSLSAKSLRDEKSKVFDSMRRSIRRRSCVASTRAIETSQGSRSAPRPRRSSRAKVAVDNWRWHGVPFYLRTGKSLAESRQVITMGFRGPALKMFPINVVETHGSAVATSS